MLGIESASAQSQSRRPFLVGNLKTLARINRLYRNESQKSDEDGHMTFSCSHQVWSAGCSRNEDECRKLVRS